MSCPQGSGDSREAGGESLWTIFHRSRVESCFGDPRIRTRESGEGSQLYSYVPNVPIGNAD